MAHRRIRSSVSAKTNKTAKTSAKVTTKAAHTTTSTLATLLPLGALAAGFGWAGLAAAQTTAPDSPPAAEVSLRKITVKGRAEEQGKDSLQVTTTRIGKGTQELRDIPQSVTVLTERLIDDRNLDTLKDALKNTAGISFQAAEGGEEDIRLRGFSLQSTGDIFIDGIRDPAFYDRDSFNWDRLEVLRGSASMLFGRGSTGGAVNQVSKQPLLLNQNEITATVGSGQYLRSTADFNLKTGDDAALRINTMVTQADNYGNKIDKNGVAGAYRWGIGLADEFQVSLYHLVNDNGINYGLPWITPGPSGGSVLWPADPKNYYGMASDYVAGGVTNGTASHLHRFLDGGELRTVLRVSNYLRDQRASAIRFAPQASQPGGAEVNSDTFSNATVLRRSNGNGVQAKIMDLDTQVLQSDYSGKFGWGGLSHTVNAGVDLSRDNFANHAFAPNSPQLTKPNTTVGTPDDGAWVDEASRIDRVDRTFQATSAGAYVQDLLQVAPAWKLLGGLRYDYFKGRYDTPALVNATGGVTAPIQRERSDSLWSKRFGVLYQPTALTSFHFSYGTSFNTSGDTYQYDALGANTAPEQSRNLELGAKIDSASGKFTARAALFHATKYNERNRDSETAGQTNYLLSGERHAAGVELDLAGRLTPVWDVFASYAWIPDAEIDKVAPRSTTLDAGLAGSRPGLTPKYTGSLWTTYQVTPELRLGGGLTARSNDRPMQSSITAPSYVIGDLMAEYRVEAVTFKLNLINVANKHYADMLYRGHYQPGKPRTLQLTAAYKF